MTAMMNPGLIKLITKHYEKENLHYSKNRKAKSAHNNSAGTFPSPFVNLEPAFKRT